jgi:small subunit ribosomal protein S1
VISASHDTAQVELGEGVLGTCRISSSGSESQEQSSSPGSLDLSALTSMLSARWKSGAAPASTNKSTLVPGQIRSFRISKLDPQGKQIELELA